MQPQHRLDLVEWLASLLNPTKAIKENLIFNFFIASAKKIVWSTHCSAILLPSCRVDFCPPLFSVIYMMQKHSYDSSSVVDASQATSLSSHIQVNCYLIVAVEGNSCCQRDRKEVAEFYFHAEIWNKCRVMMKMWKRGKEENWRKLQMMGYESNNWVNRKLSN